jgi:YidC/Oxa1 family membrane protein insertase
MILRVMPLFFGFIGYSFPSGLVLYWTVSNLFMIGQQTLLLRAGHIGPDALERRMAEQKEKMAAQADKPPKRGLMSGMMERAEEERKRREAEAKKNPPPKKGGSETQRKPKRPGSGGKHGA